MEKKKKAKKGPKPSNINQQFLVLDMDDQEFISCDSKTDAENEIVGRLERFEVESDRIAEYIYDNFIIVSLNDLKSISRKVRSNVRYEVEIGETL